MRDEIGDVIIRPCTVDDLPAVRDLRHRWAEERIVWGYEAASADDLVKALGPYFLVGHPEAPEALIACACSGREPSTRKKNFVFQNVNNFPLAFSLESAINKHSASLCRQRNQMQPKGIYNPRFSLATMHVAAESDARLHW